MTTCVMCGAVVSREAPSPRGPSPDASPTDGSAAEEEIVYDAYAPEPVAPSSRGPAHAAGGGAPYPPYSVYPATPPAPSAVWANPVARGNTSNAAAAVGFACGLFGWLPLWIGFVLCIAAIALGSVGIANANRTPSRAGRGWAIAAIVLGCVFILPASCGL